MAGEWREVRLGEVVSINPDTLGSDWPFSYIKYIDISSVGEGPIVEPPRILHLDEAPSRAKRLVREGDTVLSTVRPSRRSMFFVKEPEPEWVVSTGFAVLRPCREYIEPRYLYACVFDRGFTEFLVKREKGAAYPAVLPEDIADAVIKLPPLPEQRAIAHILGTLDDKIELNRRMSQTLEAMARALFKAWFVDFEPVRAKMEGRWERGQSLPGLPAHLYDLFPDRLVDSELGEIPEGWRVGRLGDLALVTSGKRPNKVYPEPQPYASIPLWGGNGPMGYVTEPLYSTPILLTGRVGTLGSVFRIATPCWPSDNTLVVIAREKIAIEFLYFQMKRFDYDALNRGSTQPLLTQTDLNGQQVPLPSNRLLSEFHKHVSTYFAKLDESMNESRTLAALRDVLLPKLIRGEIRVKDAERFLKERGL